MAAARKITFVTGNANKARELTAILAKTKSGCEVDTLALDLPELQGEPEEVSREKCLLAVKEVNGPVIVEDTSLCFNALGGLPSVYIKWFLEKIGHDGLNRMLAGFDDKSAYAQCVFSYCEAPGAEVHVFVGRTQGAIVPARGDNKFGWDPVFECRDPELKGHTDFGKTYAEMPSETKNQISHRARAVKALVDFLSK